MPTSASTTTDLDVALLRQTLFRLTRRLRRGAHAGITPSQLSALASVDREGPLRLGDLATAEDLAPPTLTPIVARLEAAGLVARAADPTDARGRLVRTTAAGRALLDEGRRRTTDDLAARLAQVSDEDRTALARALPVLAALLDEGRP